VAGDPTAGLADLPVNQAESEAIQRGELKLEQPEGTAPAPVVDAAREARRAAFDAVVTEQQAKVQALADRLSAAVDGEARLTLQKEIEREKLAIGRRLLELQLEFAARDGDQARSERLQAALTAWDTPAPVGAPVDRPVPANTDR
jgi:hypothetical protein